MERKGDKQLKGSFKIFGITNKVDGITFYRDAQDGKRIRF